jgi:hypothetical protein
MILRKISIALFLVSFFTMLLSDGGVYPTPVAIATIAMALSMMLALISGRLHRETSGVFLCGLSIWLVLSGWTILQSVPLPGGIFANPAWARASEAGLAVSAAISVAPGDSLQSLLPVSLAFMTFLTALLLFRSHRQAEGAIRVFAIAGSALAAFAIVQYEFFPGTLMFAPKQNYIDSLTAPFVNRNTAATFYGLVLVGTLVCLSLELAKDSRSRRRAPGGVDYLWIYAGMAVVALLALALTTSNGGISATVLALACLAWPFSRWLRGNTAGRGMRTRSVQQDWRMLASIVVGGMLAVILSILLFSQSLMRLERKIDVSGEGRACVYPNIMRAIADNWGAGIGPGSFETYYPGYHDAACGMTDAWARAHNGYLELALAYGLVVAVPVLIIAMTAVVIALRHGARHRRSKKPVVLGGFAASILVIVHTVTDFSMQIPGFAMVFLFFIAVSMTVSLNRSGQ